MLKQISFPLVFLIFLSGCAQSPPDMNLKTTQISFSGSNLTINSQIADNSQSRAKGLMYVQSMPQNEGMLFIYEKEQPLSFWMANTQIPLDIIFLDQNKKIVEIRKMHLCMELITNECPTYSSKKPSKYAIELNQNLTNKYNISIGQTASWN